MNANAINPSVDIAQPTTGAKRRGKKPSGVVKNNVCVRLTDEMKAYLLEAGGGSTSKGVSILIDQHRAATASVVVAA